MVVTGRLGGAVLVTGTDTGVGKTVVTAAIAAAARAAGRRVAVVKPAQTGTAEGGPLDTAEVVRLAGPVPAVSLAEYPAPLAPLVAAQVAGASPLRLDHTREVVSRLVGDYDLVLVEGAGGLLVPMGETGTGAPWTVADLRPGEVVVVTRAGLGTLNHTALTLEALERRELPASVVIGAWPDRPELVHRTNLDRLRPRLAGIVPDGAGRLAPDEFRRAAPGWLAPSLGGTVRDWATAEAELG